MDASPNLIILGAARCSTTSLYHFLNQYPETEGLQIDGKLIKESHSYIDSLITQPLQTIEKKKYREGFTFNTNYQLDASPHYLFYPEIIPILQKIKGLKLIIILRDPFQRAFSSHKHASMYCGESLSFKQALQRERGTNNLARIEFNYVKQSSYYRPLAKWKEAFSSDQLKVLIFEDIRDRYEQAMSDTLSWLDIDHDSILAKNTNKSVSYIGGVEKYTKLWRKVMPKQMRTASLVKSAKSLLTKKSSISELEVFREHYISEVESLENLLNCSLKNKWNDYTK